MEKEKLKGVLLVNLGSPDSTSTRDVKRYLREFLMDKRVIDVPFILRFFLVNFIIVPFRARKSAALYKKIWWKEGSPLKVISQWLNTKIQDKVNIPVEMAMRYANPSIESVMRKMYDGGIIELFVIPLYPQYAMSTTETVVEECKRVQEKYCKDLELIFDTPFYNEPEYIECLVKSLENNVKQEVDAVLFTYHGIPERHIYKTDTTGTCKIGECCFEPNVPSHPKCYRYQCYETTKLVQKAMAIPSNKVFQSFQSRLGNDPWLEPFTDKTLSELPSKSIETLVVIAPAFVSDCLETLEEIAIEGSEEFIENGGKKMIYVPCLNDNEDWVNFLVKRINNYLK